MENQTTRFPISKDLKKLITLPNEKEFGVDPQDLLVAGSVLSYTKNKAFLFDKTSSLTNRQMALTKQGYFVIWMKPTQGFVLDVRMAKSIFVLNEICGKNGAILRSCCIKIKFAFGSVKLFLQNEKISVWRRSLQDIFDGQIAVKTTKTEETEMTNVEEEMDTTFMASKKSDSLITCCESLPELLSDASSSSGSAPSVLRSDTQISLPETTKSISTRSPITVIPKRLEVSVKQPIKPVESDTAVVDEVIKAMLELTIRSNAKENQMAANLDQKEHNNNPRNSIRSGFLSVAAIRNNLEAKAAGVKNEPEVGKAPNGNGKSPSRVAHMDLPVSPLPLPMSVSSIIRRPRKMAEKCESAPAAFNNEGIQQENHPQFKFSVSPYKGWKKSIQM